MKRSCLLVLLITLFGTVSKGAFLGETYRSYNFADSLNVTFQIWYAPSYFVPDAIPGTVLDWNNISVAEYRNTTIFVDENVDPDFSTFISMLTNGNDDHLRFNLNYDGVDQVSGDYESIVLGFADGISNSIDFQSFEIEKIGFTITDSGYSVSYYSVPEPTTMFMFLIGTFGVLKRHPKNS